MDDEPLTASDFYHLGVECLQQGDFARALDYVNKAIARNYFGAEIAVVKGEILFELRRYQEALEWFDRAISLDQSLATDATMWKGRVFFELGQFGRALSAFNRVIQNTAMPGDAYLYKGMVLCERGDLSKAWDALEEARALIGDDREKLADILYWQGRSLKGQGRPSEAAACFEKALAAVPDFVDVYIELGELCRIQGRLDAACDIYRRGIQEVGDDPALYNDLGNALRDRGELEASLDALKRAIELDGEGSVAVFNRALTYERMARWDEALADYASVVTADSSDLDCRLRRLDILSRLERFEEASDELAQVPHEDLDKPEVQELCAKFLNRRARSLEALGRQGEALALYVELLNIHPDFLDFDNPGRQFSSARERQEKVLAQLDALEVDPAQVATMALVRASILVRLGRRAEALAQIEAARTSAWPELAELIFADVAYFDGDDTEGALAAIDRALARRPQFVAALWLRATILHETDPELAGTLQAFREILKISPDNPIVLDLLGKLYLEHRHPWRALQCYRTLMETMPADVAIQRELAQCYLDLGRAGEAITELRRLARLHPDDLEVRLDLAEALIRGGERDEAATLLASVDLANRGLDPSLADSCNELRGQLHVLNRRYDEALAALAKIPAEEWSLFGRLQGGIALAALNRMDEAYAAFMPVLEEAPPASRVGVRVRIELAKLARTRGDARAALESLRDALVHHPTDWHARALLAWALLETGDVAGAEREERRLGFFGELAAGMRFMHTEEFQDAVEAFRSLSVSHPDEALAHYWLAAANCMIGQFVVAGAALKRAIELDPAMLAQAKDDAFFDSFAFTELKE